MKKYTRHTRFHSNDVNNFACSDVQLNSIMHSNKGVGVSDGPGIMGNKVRNTFRASLDTSYFAELILKIQHNCD